MVQKTDETITEKKRRRESRKKMLQTWSSCCFDIPSTFLEPTPSYVEELVMYQ